MVVSQRVKKGGWGRLGKVRVRAHRETRLLGPHPPRPPGRPRPAPPRTHLERGVDRGFGPTSSPASLGEEATVSPRNQFLVLLHPLTHPSTTEVFKLPAHYRFTCRI